MAQTVRSLVWATDIDVLERNHALVRRDRYWAVHSPENPTFWWGNFLLFDDAPVDGDGDRWEELFQAEFGARTAVTHRCFAWDRTDGIAGAAGPELVARGYELEWTVGLVAQAGHVVSHPRANQQVTVQALDPDADARLWEAAIEIQMAQAPADVSVDYHRTYLVRRQRGLRELFRDGRGAWYLALLDGLPVASLGIVVTGSRARYQVVETLAAHRRKGIATRLVADAATHAARHHHIDHFVIAADPDYHAIGIYEGLGFERAERVVGALRKPDPS
jgi:GNAT superfamily N-acetyltransferase